MASRYRFDQEIGRGGWGIVYRAQDLARNRPVAVKLMAIGSGLLARRERFLQEIEVEARLVHPHIIPVFDSGEVDEIVYLVMPLIEGETLAVRLAREGPLPVRDSLRLAREVAQALAHAHEQRVVHRDIKPANIMLASGHALVADFGIARVLGAQKGKSFRTTDALGVGTPEYMAPEQADGSAGIDGRADVYSLGCVLFEMLLGRVPFEGRDHGETLRRHAVDTVPPIRTVRQTVAPEVEAIVQRAMAKIPADRYPTATAMVAALDEAFDAEPASGPRRISAPIRPNRSRWIAAAMVATALIGGGGALAAAEGSRARLIADADTTRIIVFPLESAAPVDLAADDRLRRAFARWQGIEVVDPFAVREAVGNEALVSAKANSIALRLRAGRFVRGTVVTAGGGFELRLIISAVGRRSQMLREEVARVPVAEGSIDSALADLVERLLIRLPTPPDVNVRSLSTRSVPATQAYLVGRAAVSRWQLDSARTAFEAAWATDPRFGQAALWLALTKFWGDASPTEWTLAAFGAAGDSLVRRSREGGAARALVATSLGDLPAACREWDALAVGLATEFIGFYGAALCRARDKHVERDARSPSGYSFRTSYQAALQQFLIAYRQLPAMHRSLSGNAFEAVRRQLFVSTSFLRDGRSEDGAYFLAVPTLNADTLAFTPYPAMAIHMGDPAATPDIAVQRLVERRQRELFRDVSGMWAAQDRNSSEAREAYALALQMLGDASALDTIRAAIRLEDRGSRRYLLAATEAWLRVGFALPDDWTSLATARAIADTVLASDSSAAGAPARSTLAALTGRLSLLLDTTSIGASRIDRDMTKAIADASSSLTFLAAMGASATSIALAEHKVDSLIVALAPDSGRDRLRSAAYGRAARLAWPAAPLSRRAMATVQQDYLIPALRAAAVGDSVVLRREVARLRMMRERTPPSEVALDALRAEAALLRHIGEPALAAAWLDAALATVRTTTPDFDSIKAAALVRSMMLRAELADELGQPSVARRWAGAVVALWSGADAELRPLVDRMRALSK